MLPPSPNTDWRRDGRTALAWLVAHFHQDPSHCRPLIREILGADRRAFLPKALEVLHEGPESRGAQYVMTLLVANDLLLPALCDPSLDREQAVALARGALRVDSMADITLAKALVHRNEETVAHPARLMDILDAISSGPRILPSLLRLLHHDDPHIRSKAVLMIGRGSRGVRWVERRLADPDPRVRANAIESMWGLNRPEAHSLLQKALRDPNNRVAANAVLGLYLLGDCASIPELLKMGENHAPPWRSTAAWAMGETADPRFLIAIAERLRDAEPAVRRRAYWALTRVKAAAAKVAQCPQWRMVGHFRPPGHGSNSRCVRVALASEVRLEVPALLPTQFMLAEEGRPVSLYQVAESEAPPALSVAFVFPSGVGRARPPWVEGALWALRWKRDSDLWGVLPYCADASRGHGPPPAEGGNVVFCSIPEAVRSALLHPTSTGVWSDLWNADLWNAVWNAVQCLKRLVRGEKRIIVCSNVRESRAAGMALLSSVISSSTHVQVIATEENPRLEEFCRQTDGLFRRVQGEEQVAAAVEEAYLQLLARYEISYSVVSPEAHTLMVRAHTPSGWAEMALAIPPPEPSG
ncbi:MAG TPA: HEAT repeat domain-containing protein [Bryobacteraceae bacterium]|nr:HEAT repeat domain-containing protein [Bryobacteraceae bacterium]